MPTLDLLVIDEAHHAIANGYMRIIDKTKELNPECMIYGVTATPMRGDRKGLRPIFSNVSDQITLEELTNIQIMSWARPEYNMHKAKKSKIIPI